MSTMLNPRAVARIKAAFDTCELVAQTVVRRRAVLAKPKAPIARASAPARTKMVYERGSVRLVAACD